MRLFDLNNKGAQINEDPAPLRKEAFKPNERLPPPLGVGMLGKGLEPSRGCSHGILSRLRYTDGHKAENTGVMP